MFIAMLSGVMVNVNILCVVASFWWFADGFFNVLKGFELDKDRLGL
jgi:hypothetical protein